MLDIIESHTVYMMAAEDSIKRMNRDLEIYRGVPTSTKELSSSKGTSLSSRGTKDIMRAIQELKAENNNEPIPIEEAKTVPDEPFIEDTLSKELEEDEKEYRFDDDDE